MTTVDRIAKIAQAAKQANREYDRDDLLSGRGLRQSVTDTLAYRSDYLFAFQENGIEGAPLIAWLNNLFAAVDAHAKIAPELWNPAETALLSLMTAANLAAEQQAAAVAAWSMPGEPPRNDSEAVAVAMLKKRPALTNKEAALATGVSVRTVCRWTMYRLAKASLKAGNAPRRGFRRDDGRIEAERDDSEE